MSQLRRSLLITFFSSNGATAVNFFVTLVLARFLSPEDIGIFSIASVMVAVAQIFRDFGVGSYLQHEKELTAEKIRAATGVMIASSWSLACLIYLAAAPAAAYYGHDGIREVMHVLALGFLFIPLGASTHALLTRELRAREQAVVYVWGTSAYAISSITLACLDFGYMTSAWANLINIVVTGLAYMRYRPSYAPWLPSFANWRAVVHFGTGTVLSNSIGAVNESLADLLLGRLNGPRDVGLYSRANGLSGLFMKVLGPTVNYAALPHMSRTYHETGDISALLAKSSAYLSALAWPALALLAIFAKETVVVLYGETWLDSVPVVPVACGIMAIALSVHFVGVSLTATGRPYLAVVPNLALLLLRILGIALVYDGTLLSFALGMLFGSLFAVPVFVFIQRRYLQFGVRACWQAQRPSLVVTAGVVAIGLLLQLCVPSEWSAHLTLVIVAAVAIPVWYLLLRALKHPLFNELPGSTSKSGASEKPEDDQQALLNGDAFVYFSRNPMVNYKHMARFHAAVTAAGMEFHAISFIPGHPEKIEQLCVNGKVVLQHIYSELSLQSLRYPVKTAAQPFRLIPGNTDIPQLLFWQRNPNFERYWFMEDDVDYSGRIETLLGSVGKIKGDLLATHFSTAFSDWDYAQRFRSGNDVLESGQHYLCFLPFIVVSSQALATLHARYQSGWDGHPEMVWPTALCHANLEVVDIGGQGPYVRPELKGRHYAADVGDQNFRKHGSFGTQKIRLRPGPVPDMLWHPVKSPRYWLVARTKRTRSVIEWHCQRFLYRR